MQTGRVGRFEMPTIVTTQGRDALVQYFSFANLYNILGAVQGRTVAVEPGRKLQVKPQVLQDQPVLLAVRHQEPVG